MWSSTRLGVLAKRATQFGPLIETALSAPARWAGIPAATGEKDPAAHPASATLVARAPIIDQRWWLICKERGRRRARSHTHLRPSDARDALIAPQGTLTDPGLREGTNAWGASGRLTGSSRSWSNRHATISGVGEILDSLAQMVGMVLGEEPRLILWLVGFFATLAAFAWLVVRLAPQAIVVPLLTVAMCALVVVLTGGAWWQHLRSSSN